MSEWRPILARARALEDESGGGAFLATLVSVRGSAYRRPGARALIDALGAATGSVSGGCVERDLARRAEWLTSSAPSVLVSYDALDLDDGMQSGTGCPGSSEVLLQRLEHTSGLLSFVERCLVDQREGLVATVFRTTDDSVLLGSWIASGPAGDHVGSLAPEVLEGGVPRLESGSGPARRTVRTARGSVDILVEWVVPPPSLFVMGAGPDAAPVVSLAASLGWMTTVWDPTSRFETRARFEAADIRRAGPASGLRPALDAARRAAAIVMSHDLERDREALAMLLPSKALYVGVLGPRRRTDRLLADIGHPPSDPRLFSPAGLSIGSESPAEIALSVVAELKGVLAREAVGHLRDRHGPIHARDAEPEPVAVDEVA